MVFPGRTLSSRKGKCWEKKQEHQLLGHTPSGQFPGSKLLYCFQINIHSSHVNWSFNVVVWRSFHTIFVNVYFCPVCIETGIFRLLTRLTKMARKRLVNCNCFGCLLTELPPCSWITFLGILSFLYFYIVITLLQDYPPIQKSQIWQNRRICPVQMRK